MGAGMCAYAMICDQSLVDVARVWLEHLAFLKIGGTAVSAVRFTTL